LLFSALQADRSDKNNTGSNNNKSCLKISSSIVDPFNFASGHRLYECRGGVNKKVLTISFESIYLFAVVNGETEMNTIITTKGYFNFGRFFFSFRSVHPAG